MALNSAGLSTHVWNNNLRSLALLALYPVILFAMMWAIGFILGQDPLWRDAILDRDGGVAATFDPDTTPIEFAWRFLFAYWPIMASVVAIWFTISFFFHTRMIRALARSHPVSRKEEPELYNLLENLAIAEGMPMPRLEIIETHARNAFASGIDTKSYTVTVTRGLLNALARDEVEAVLAHELSHIQNRDVRLLIVTVIFTGMLGFLAQMTWNAMRYNMFVTRSRSRDGKGNSAVFVVLAIMAVLWAGYFLTLFTRFALSRRREYMADAGAVRMTKNPEAMMRALMRIARRDRIPETTDDIAMMCVENAKPFMGLFSTHPPIKQRIGTISRMTRTPVPRLPNTGPAPWGERFNAGAREDVPAHDPWLTAKRGKRKPPAPWGPRPV